MERNSDDLILYRLEELEKKLDAHFEKEESFYKEYFELREKVAKNSYFITLLTAIVGGVSALIGQFLLR